MSNRKQTPDVLGAVLGGPRDYPAFSEELPPVQPEQQASGQPLPSVTQRGEQPARHLEPVQEGTTVQPQTPPHAPAEGQPASQTAQPQEWEYREVVFRDYRGWRTREVNGRELGNWKNSPTLIEYLEQAGKEGWELVSVGDRHNNQKEAYFKRPKQ
jgi:hypothetical protein